MKKSIIFQVTEAEHKSIKMSATMQGKSITQLVRDQLHLNIEVDAK